MGSAKGHWNTADPAGKTQTRGKKEQRGQKKKKLRRREMKNRFLFRGFKKT